MVSCRQNRETSLFTKGRREEFKQGELKRGGASLTRIVPLSLKGEGDTGGEGVSDWVEKPKI